MNDFVKKLNNLATDISNLDYFNKAEKKLRQDFFDIMRKYNIKKGYRETDESGTVYNNPEWIICERLFFDRMAMRRQLKDLLEKIPADLEYYVKKK